MTLKVYYIDGSPYARIVRASLIEFGVAHEAKELASYPPAGISELTPAWQVPVLEDQGRRLFGSSLIRDYVHQTYGIHRTCGTGPRLSPHLTREAHHWEDAQILTAIETLTASLVHNFHAQWAGVRQEGENRLGGVDIAQRDLDRAMSLLDWLEGQAKDDGFWPEASGGFAPADIAFSAAVLWTEAREEIAWRGRPRLERIVARIDGRESFQRTAPRPWPNSPKTQK